MTLLEPYRLAARFAMLCPILFLIPAVMEMVQHAAEAQLGFYDSLAAMKAADGAPQRMILGHFKVIALFLAGYWAVRFFAFGNDPVAARTIDPHAVRLFIPVMLWGLFWLVALQDGPILARMAGLSMRPVAISLVAVLLADLLFEVCVATWKTAAVVGNGEIGFLRSIRLSRGDYWWALGLTLVAMLPLMIVHYGLAIMAIGQPFWMTTVALILDSLLVAYMVPVSLAANVIIARRVTARNGIALLPAQ